MVDRNINLITILINSIPISDGFLPCLRDNISRFSDIMHIWNAFEYDAFFFGFCFYQKLLLATVRCIKRFEKFRLQSDQRKPILKPIIIITRVQRASF